MPSEEGFNFSNPKNGALDFGYSFSENWAVEAQVSQSITEGSTSSRESVDFTNEVRASLVSDQGYTSQQAVQAVKSATFNATATADVSVDSYGIYGVYRTSGALYAKIKAGVLNVKSSVDIGVKNASMTVVNSSNVSSTLSADDLGIDTDEFTESASESETEFSIGVGGGYKFSDKFALELEYTRLSSDLDSYSLGAKYFF